MTFAITVCFWGSGVDNREFDIAYWSKFIPAIHFAYTLVAILAFSWPL